MSAPALTTIFSPPSECFSTVYLYTTNDDEWYQLGPDPRVFTSCYPPHYSPAPDFYYSPARDCPLGYTTAAVDTLTTFGTVTETRATCCPTSFYSYQIDKTSHAYYSTIGCTVYAAPVSYYTTLPVWRPGGTAAIRTQGVGIGMNAYSVQIRWQASNTMTPSSMQILSTSALSTTPPNTTSSSSPTDPAPSGSLSAGAKVGIGVGVTFGVTTLALMIFLAYCLGRRRGLPPSVGQTSATHGYNKPELSADVNVVGFDWNQQLHELGGNQQRVEMPDNARVQ